MVKETSRRYMRHCLGGAIGIAPNALVYLIMRFYELAPEYQTIIPFAVAGQIAFWIHDRWTYRDRHPTLDDWLVRWLWFMPGQVGGGLLNLWVADRTKNEYDWRMVAVYLAANVAGSLVTFLWTNFLSHRDKKSKSPDESRPES